MSCKLSRRVAGLTRVLSCSEAMCCFRHLASSPSPRFVEGGVARGEGETASVMSCELFPSVR